MFIQKKTNKSNNTYKSLFFGETTSFHRSYNSNKELKLKRKTQNLREELNTCKAQHNLIYTQITKNTNIGKLTAKKAMPLCLEKRAISLFSYQNNYPNYQSTTGE